MLQNTSRRISKRRPEQPYFCPERIVAKVLITMMVKRLYTAYRLLTFLEQESAVGQQFKGPLQIDGPFPSRRTWKKQLANLPQLMPSLNGSFGFKPIVL
ncbi:MAG: hypothetical protein H6657_03260 [Ardenticatenaceae bacterium]|nr:hypothetical protein [Ardenticatenaceae bacterium]